MNYRTREGARDFIVARGIPLKGDGLKDHATRGTGPRYVIINGRALYTESDLMAWIEAQASRPPRKRNSSRHAA